MGFFDSVCCAERSLALFFLLQNGRSTSFFFFFFFFFPRRFLSLSRRAKTAMTGPSKIPSDPLEV